MFTANVIGQEVDNLVLPSIFDEMAHSEVTKVKITSDFTFIKENKRSQDKIDATFQFQDSDGKWISYDANLTIRGKYRRMFSENIPPLKIDFSKNDLEKDGFAKYDDYKLVTFFHEDKGESYQTLVKEYLTYKAFNILSEYSYRVQLLEIEYTDINSNEKYIEFGFIIEDNAQLEDRINGKQINDEDKVDTSLLHKTQTELVALFQYMVGNSDWNMASRKNVDFFEVNGKIIPIPYDFDFCGLVNASYAVPNNFYHLNSVQDRVFLGYNDKVEVLFYTYRLFEHKKEEIKDLFAKCKLLSRNNRTEAIAYLDSFYKDFLLRKEHGVGLNDTLSQVVISK